MSDDMPDPLLLLERAANRMACDDTFLAFAFRHWYGEELDLRAVARELACDISAVVRAALCRRPRLASYQADIAAIARSTGMDADCLAAVLRPMVTPVQDVLGMSAAEAEVAYEGLRRQAERQHVSMYEATLRLEAASTRGGEEYDAASKLVRRMVEGCWSITRDQLLLAIRSGRYDGRLPEDAKEAAMAVVAKRRAAELRLAGRSLGGG